MKNISDKEKEIIQALKVLGVKYLFRDEVNRLYASDTKPLYDRSFKEWYIDDEIGFYITQFNDLFKFVGEYKGYKEL